MFLARTGRPWRGVPNPFLLCPKVAAHYYVTGAPFLETKSLSKLKLLPISPIPEDFLFEKSSSHSAIGI